MIEKKEIQRKNSQRIELYIEKLKLNECLEKEDYLDDVINDLKVNEYYKILGFSDLKEIEGFLRFIIFGKEQIEKEIIFNKKEIVDLISEFEIKCADVIADDKLKIFILPTYNKFTIEKMLGVSGFCTSKNTILIALNSFGNWRKELRSALIHELPHSLSSYYDMANLSIGEGLVFDGIAENFREHITNSSHSRLVEVIDKEKSLKIFKEIKDKLAIRERNLYGEIFFGIGKYPLWAGYAIGYHLIKEYLKNQKKIDWSKIVRKNPTDILKEIVK